MHYEKLKKNIIKWLLNDKQFLCHALPDLLSFIIYQNPL